MLNFCEKNALFKNIISNKENESDRIFWNISFVEMEASN
jgi:hypothetical protein